MGFPLQKMLIMGLTKEDAEKRKKEKEEKIQQQEMKARKAKRNKETTPLIELLCSVLVLQQSGTGAGTGTPPLFYFVPHYRLCNPC